jgi:hypothetical protein
MFCYLRLIDQVRQPARPAEVTLAADKCPLFLRLNGPVSETFRRGDDSGEREDFPPVGGALQDRLRRREPPAAQELITLIESDRPTSSVGAVPVLATTALHSPQHGEKAFRIVHCRMRWLSQEGCHRKSSEIAPSGTISLENAPLLGTFVGSWRENLEWRSL